MQKQKFRKALSLCLVICMIAGFGLNMSMPAKVNAATINHGFETSITPWVGGGGATVARSSDYANTGSYSLKVTGANTTANYTCSAQIPLADLGITSAGTYNYSYWIYTNNPAGMTGAIQNQVVLSSNGSGLTVVGNYQNITSGTWKNITGTFTVDANAAKDTADSYGNQGLRFQFNPASSSTAKNPGVFYLDDVQVTSSSTATPTPTPTVTPTPAPTPVYSAGFESSTDGWGTRWSGAGTVDRSNEQKRSGSYSLKTSSRTSSAHGPTFDFTQTLTAGGSYTLSLWVYHTKGSAVTFNLSKAYTVTGSSESYSNITTKSIPSGVWTNISVIVNARTDVSKLALYLETTESGTFTNFYIDDVAVTSRSVTAPIGLPQLKTIYANKFLMGVAVSADEFDLAAKKTLIADQYNLIAVGNEMKPVSNLNLSASTAVGKDSSYGDYVNPQVSISADAKAILDFAKAKGMKVHGHTLIWHTQTPSWLFYTNYDTSSSLASRTVMLKRMENYIKNTLQMYEAAYGNTIISWDVSNEVLSDSTSDADANGLRNNSMWYKTIGSDYVEKSFTYARTYARSDMQLYYNDYNISSGSSDYKSANAYKLVKAIWNAAKVNGKTIIDGIGFQSHHNLTWPSVSSAKSSMQQYTNDSTMGSSIKLRISELDITIYNATEATSYANNPSIMASRYQELFKLYNETGIKEKITSITIWGLDDSTSWLHQHQPQQVQHPLPFDESLTPKNIFYAIANLNSTAPYSP